MNDTDIIDIPSLHEELLQKSEEIDFTMPSDLYIGTMLKTLIASKPNANILELGTGIGLSLSWMIDGMDKGSRITTVDNDPKLIAIAKRYFGDDKRVKIVCADGTDWIRAYEEDSFDLIFADAWPGKYSEIAETLDMVKIGGFYIIDDMTPQSNWPSGHQDHVDGLVDYLEKREDFTLTKLNWSTGVLIAVRTLK